MFFYSVLSYPKYVNRSTYAPNENVFRWDEMEWNISGQVTIDNINSMKDTIYPVAQGKQIGSMKDLLCGRSQYSDLLTNYSKYFLI